MTEEEKLIETNKMKEYLTNQKRQVKSNGERLCNSIKQAKKRIDKIAEVEAETKVEHKKDYPFNENITTDSLSKVYNSLYEIDSEKRNKKIQEIVEKQQLDDFIFDNKKFYVYEDERVVDSLDKERDFANAVVKKYQGVLDKIREAEGITRNNKEYKKLREDIKTIQITVE